ncbi:MAG: serine/threonine-protein phosphatase [candidate division NC10 bacterium]|nr:serine/threonine-protein phosphatase [candidate division NC10 bacterium]
MSRWRAPGRMLSSLVHHFGRQSTAALLAKGYLTTLLITVIDYATGREVSLLVSYLFPIIVISWFVGRRQGIGIALAAAFASVLQDLLQSDSSLLREVQNLNHLWRFLQGGGVFLLVSLIIAALRNSEREKRKIEQRLARTVQSFLLPQTARSAGSLTCYGRCKSSDYLTGDFFDLIPVGPARLAILVGDICGKGISAALLMAYIQGLLRSHTPFVEGALAELMNNINRSLHLVTADDRFATLFIGIYDDESRLLTYVNAGHDPPVIFRRAMAADAGTRHGILEGIDMSVQARVTPPSIEVIKLENGGLLLGVDPEFAYQTLSEKLHDGDVLLLDTDGMKEAMDARQEMYGAERLTHIVASHHGESAEEIHDRIFADVEAFVGGEPQTDDMTLVIGTVSPRLPSSAANPPGEEGEIRYREALVASAVEVPADR